MSMVDMISAKQAYVYETKVVSGRVCQCSSDQSGHRTDPHFDSGHLWCRVCAELLTSAVQASCVIRQSLKTCKQCIVCIRNTKTEIKLQAMRPHSYSYVPVVYGF